ncbi:hypothetical protein HJG60_010115 [Phyllostomus discolor]|uniref:Uncharacterized protein n=1 Tax=Phyllostomus discolor TaxID=89673 RepID=A0A834EG48_9CHIR|nr:hypothetical protein HJG60_010115 [Phyllostomus discolor]
MRGAGEQQESRGKAPGLNATLEREEPSLVSAGQGQGQQPTQGSESPSWWSAVTLPGIQVPPVTTRTLPRPAILRAAARGRSPLWPRRSRLLSLLRPGKELRNRGSPGQKRLDPITSQRGRNPASSALVRARVSHPPRAQPSPSWWSVVTLLGIQVPPVTTRTLPRPASLGARVRRRSPLWLSGSRLLSLLRSQEELRNRGSPGQKCLDPGRCQRRRSPALSALVRARVNHLPRALASPQWWSVVTLLGIQVPTVTTRKLPRAASLGAAVGGRSPLWPRGSRLLSLLRPGEELGYSGGPGRKVRVGVRSLWDTGGETGWPAYWEEQVPDTQRERDAGGHSEYRPLPKKAAPKAEDLWPVGAMTIGLPRNIFGVY